MASFFTKTALFAGTAFIIASCNFVNVDGESRNLSIRYGQDKIALENGSLFRVGDSYTKNFSDALTNLRAAGLTVLASDIRTGRIDIGSNLNEMVDCGSIATGPSNDLNVFAANSARSVLEVRADGGGSTFVLRSVDVSSTATVMLGADASRNGDIFASISEQHSVRLSISQTSDESVIYDQTVQFSGRETAQFRRGIECGTARYIRKTLKGN